MSLTKVTPAVIAVTNNITSNTFGSANTIPSFQIDGSGVIIAASNTAINLTANSVANNQFQTGSIENYMRAQGTFAGNRNKIINGAMMIDQRNSGTSVSVDTSGSQYSLDRWLVYGTQGAKYTVQQDSSANTVAGFTSSLKVVSSSSYSLNGTDSFHITQRIEGLNCVDLAWGTASAKTVTLSFWVRSSLTGTFGGVVKNNATDYNYPFSYTIVAANTWEQKFITITGPTSGTWLTTTGCGLNLRFSLGTNYTGTAGSWTGGYIDGPTGQTSVVGTNAATWYITGVQFEVGASATPFEYRHYGTELQLCQRYYWRLLPNTTSNAGDGGFAAFAHWSTTAAYTGIIFPVPMRVAPTGSTATVNSTNFAYLQAGNGFTPSSIDMSQSSSNRMELIVNFGSSTITAGYAGWLRLNASTSYLAFSAEL